jgi:hypothetical protein
MQPYTHTLMCIVRMMSRCTAYLLTHICTSSHTFACVGLLGLRGLHHHTHIHKNDVADACIITPTYPRAQYSQSTNQHLSHTHAQMHPHVRAYTHALARTHSPARAHTHIHTHSCSSAVRVRLSNRSRRWRRWRWRKRRRRSRCKEEAC